MPDIATAAKLAEPPNTGARFWPAWPVLLAALAGTAISIALIGYLFPHNNNIYHVPFVLEWSKDPAFANDAFVQSLRNYTSGWWWLVRLVATETNLPFLFLAMHVLTRWFSIVALVVVATSLGVTTQRSQIVLAVWFGLTPLLMGHSPVGDDGLFIPSFTHTELTHPFVLLSIALVIRGRIIAGLALLGVIFDINAFVAVWTGVALAVVGGVILYRGRARWRGVVLRALTGVAAAFLIALPVLVWIYTSLHAQTPYEPFDYAGYLRSFYPNHFLIGASKLSEIILLLGLVCAGLLGLRLAGRAGELWAVAFVGLCLVFAIGVVAPFVTQAPAMFNLHLLRVDGLIQTLAVAALAAMSTRWIERGGEARMAGAASLALLSLPPVGVALLSASLLWLGDRRDRRVGYGIAAVGFALIALSLSHASRVALAVGLVEVMIFGGFVFRERIRKDIPFLRPGLVAAACSVLALSAVLSVRAMHETYDASDKAYIEAAHWLHDETAPSSLVLIPLARYPMEAQFQIAAHRPLWVGMKAGAVVMWMPSYYAQWRRRVSEVWPFTERDTKLGLADKIAYACRNGIDYVVHEKRREDDLPPDQVAFQNSYFVVIHAPSACA